MNPGFDKAKYIDLLSVAAQQVDSVAANSPIPQPQRFADCIGRPSWGWITAGNSGRVPIWLPLSAFAIQRSTRWAGWNFYAAMVPAKGHIVLTNDYRFDYQLASDPRVAV